MVGHLYIVATPIGNLGDITKRAIEILQQVDLIAAEDTRRSKILLEHFAISSEIIAYHEHNENKLTPKLIKYLDSGKSIALISDAGTPLINDPGYKLVISAHDKDIKVIPIPGVSAIITGLSVSGIPCNKFIFEGYLPSKTISRKKYLKTLITESRTLVFYEAPHRISELIADMCIIFGSSRRIAIARELTKKHEQILQGTLSSIKLKIETGEIKNKGEFVVLVEGEQENLICNSEILRINHILLEKLSSKDAIKLTAQITKKKKNDIYKLVVENDKT